MDLQSLLEKTLAGLGYELVETERSAKGRLLRIFIDKPEGVSLDDCVLVSNQLTRLFEVESIDYDRLEVSSPGMDRPLKRAEDFRRFEGERAKVRVKVPIAGQRNFAGILRGVDGENLQLEVAGALISIGLATIDKARLVPEF